MHPNQNVPPGDPQQQGYLPPPQVHAGARSARTFGLASILCGFLAPIALIKGLSASKELKRYPGAYSNASDATIGTVLGAVVSALIVIGIATGGAGSKGKSAGGSSGGAEPFSGGAAASLPFVAKVEGNCARYKAAKNEIQKSAVFTENEELLSEVTLTDVRGELKKISTTQGGGELALRIHVGDVEFATESLFAPIKKGTDVYKVAAELAEGQCVVFSASGLRASSLTEQAKVCDPEYFAKITALRPCG